MSDVDTASRFVVLPKKNEKRGESLDTRGENTFGGFLGGLAEADGHVTHYAVHYSLCSRDCEIDLFRQGRNDGIKRREEKGADGNVNA